MKKFVCLFVHVFEERQKRVLKRSSKEKALKSINKALEAACPHFFFIRKTTSFSSNRNLSVREFTSNGITMLNTGILKLYLLATPIFVFRNLVTLQGVFRHFRYKNITQKCLNLKFIGQIDFKILITKFGDHFLDTGDPQKGRNPYFENRWLNRITLGRHKSDNSKRRIQFCVQYRYNGTSNI